MRLRPWFVLLFAISLLSSISSARDFSFTGTFNDPNQVQYFTFTVSPGSHVVLESYSYAGGKNAAGVQIAPGGFDPTIAVFRTSDAAPWFKANDDDFVCHWVQRDPTTNVCYDVYWEATAQTVNPSAALGTFQAGTYGVVLMNESKFSNDVVSGSVPLRDGHWALDIKGVDSAQLVGAQNQLLAQVGAPAASLSFGPQAVGTTSLPQSVTLTNPGSTALAISSIVMGGTNVTNFAQTNDCATSLAAGASCTIKVTLTPKAAVPLSAKVLVNDAVGTQTIDLIGSGVQAKAALSATSLSFAPQAVGSTSAVQSVTLSNTGNGPLSITSITMGGTNVYNFVQTNDCGTMLADGASCTVNVVLTPKAAVSVSAKVIISDSVGTQNIALSGTGK
jgi:Abnormal spindle-like microcephaly-assoc'd, ASPM-SPD-2-Hydin